MEKGIFYDFLNRNTPTINRRFKTQHLDVLIIGGGITGAGVACKPVPLK